MITSNWPCSFVFYTDTKYRTKGEKKLRVDFDVQTDVVFVGTLISEKCVGDGSLHIGAKCKISEYLNYLGLTSESEYLPKQPTATHLHPTHSSFLQPSFHSNY